ncbi:uncharacterized protein VTP21DRAFT_4146 [Calcarisporiella thermophila]|uniref:uncharacterized protein n=1 Tax=Calcarisporiella thermophila TaxID=911321 RepID=UPI00374216F5
MVSENNTENEEQQDPADHPDKRQAQAPAPSTLPIPEQLSSHQAQPYLARIPSKDNASTASKNNRSVSATSSQVSPFQNFMHRLLHPEQSSSTMKPRFELLPDGKHIHHLNPQPLRKSHLSHLFHRERHLAVGQHNEEKGKGLEKVKEKVEGSQNGSEKSLCEKYGTVQEVIGQGAWGVVRVAHKLDLNNPGSGETLYAVKEFKKRHQETNKSYVKRLTSEFCISSTLHHINIIRTLDLLPWPRTDEYCEVMEYAGGGDVYSLISSTKDGLEPAEADCFFKQLVNGVNYLHKLGVAHRDLKPENLLLTIDGCIKLADFGNSDCFRIPWCKESEVQLSRGIVGSTPYIAPELWMDTDYDARLADVWSCGIIYVVMRTGCMLWQVARDGQDFRWNEYKDIMKRRHQREQARCNKGEEGTIEMGASAIGWMGYEPIEQLGKGVKNLLYHILEPDPKYRFYTSDILSDEWFTSIYCCHESNEAEEHTEAEESQDHQHDKASSSKPA